MTLTRMGTVFFEQPPTNGGCFLVHRGEEWNEGNRRQAVPSTPRATTFRCCGFPGALVRTVPEWRGIRESDGATRTTGAAGQAIRGRTLARCPPPWGSVSFVEPFHQRDHLRCRQSAIVCVHLLHELAGFLAVPGGHSCPRLLQLRLQ